MTAVRLGLRLAGSPPARPRTALLVIVSAIATGVMLTTLAIAHFELLHTLTYQRELPRVVAAVVLAIALPCGVLVTTVARLSAALRDRRLANLRLIGLTPVQTRLVAASETSVAAFAGALVGCGLFWLARPVVIAHPLAGRAWDSTLSPTLTDHVIVTLAVPVLVGLAVLVPTRSSGYDALAVARRADRRPPGWWRLAPLALGIAFCGAVVVKGQQSAETTDQQITTLLLGVGLIAVGLVLVLPVFVRLIARLALTRDLGATARLAVRRMEAYPAGVARVISALLVGLFLVAGARYIVAAFESTPQYMAAAHEIEFGQRVAVRASAGESASVVGRLRSVDGVRSVVDLPTVVVPGTGIAAVVATCADLERVSDQLRGCRDGVAMWIVDDGGNRMPDGSEPPKNLSWRADEESSRVVVTTPSHLPVIGTASDADNDDAMYPVYASAVIPPSLVPGDAAGLPHVILVVGSPGRGFAESLLAERFSIDGWIDPAEYDSVAAMRALTWTVAAVILGLGLLALAIAAIDRAIQRRKEIVGLQLVGVSPRVLRRAQLLEAGFPIGVGVIVAIACGALAGATYLSLTEAAQLPWRQTWVLLAVSLAGSLAVAGLSVLASSPRMRPEEIRAE